MHISRASLESLNDAFDVEPGSGGDRDQFLADNNIETFLIVGRKKTASVGKQSREAIKHIFTYGVACVAIRSISCFSVLFVVVPSKLILEVIISS